MRFIAITMAAASLLASSLPSAAAEPVVLRLADVLASVRSQNPALQAAESRARAAAAVPARVRALDDPTFGWEVFNAPESLRIDQAENNILKLTQALPFPGKRALAGQVAEHDAERVRLDGQRLVLDLVRAATRAYVDLWLAYELRAIDQRDGTLAARAVRLAADRYAVGAGSQAEALEAEVDRSPLLERAATAALEIDAAQATLNALLSRPAAEPLGVPEAPPAPRLRIDVETLTTRALAVRPEVAAAESAVAGAEDGRRLAARSSLPDFELTVSRFQNTDAPDGFGAMASVTLPFAYPAKYAAARDEAAAMLAAATAERRRIDDEVRREVRQAYLRVQAAEIRHDLLRSRHVPQAEQRVRVAESDYTAGTADFATLAARVRAVAETHRAHAQAVADLATARAELDRAVGVSVTEIEGGAGAPAAGSAR